MTPTLLTASDALAWNQPVQWQLDRILSIASTALLYGAPGTKKTYAALDLAVCTALGKPWLDTFPVRQGPVLIVDEESGRSRLLRRLGEVLRGHLADASTPISAYSLERFNFWQVNPPCGALDLQTAIKHLQAKLVIIDALADVMLGGDENAVKDTQRVFNTLRQVAEKTGAAIVLIHHGLKNGNGYRGSSAIGGALDCSIEVDSKLKDSVVKFSTTKPRDGEPLEWAGECHWIMSGAPQFFMTGAQTATGGTAKPYSKGERAVLEFLLSQPNCVGTSAEIETGTGRASGTVRNITATLVTDGRLIRLSGGGAGNPGTFKVDPIGLVDRPL